MITHDEDDESPKGTNCVKVQIKELDTIRRTPKVLYFFIGS